MSESGQLQKRDKIFFAGVPFLLGVTVLYMTLFELPEYRETGLGLNFFTLLIVVALVFFYVSVTVLQD